MTAKKPPAVASAVPSAVYPPSRLRGLLRHPPGHRPPQLLTGRPTSAVDRIVQLAAEHLGEDQGPAIRAALSLTSTVDRTVLRAVLTACLPKSRPVPLAVGRIRCAKDYGRATEMILDAVAAGQMTLDEAESWQRIVRLRWHAVIAEKAGRGL